MNKDLKYFLSLCLFFGLFFLTKEVFFAKIYYLVESVIHLYPLSFFLAYAVVGLPAFIFVFFANQHKLFAPLGLKGNLVKGFLFAFLFSIPMFIGYGIFADFKPHLEWKNFWFMCVFAAFFEELYYRGFFFGQLFKNTKFGFFISLIFSALVFASLHLYQSNDLLTLIGIFMTTFMGAGLFAWLYVEWNDNLWLPVALHFFMNLSWEIFAVSDNALGSLEANLIRGLTIFLAITGTLVYKKRQNIPLAVNRRTLWMKK